MATFYAIQDSQEKGGTGFLLSRSPRGVKHSLFLKYSVPMLFRFKDLAEKALQQWLISNKEFVELDSIKVVAVEVEISNQLDNKERV